MPAPKKRMRRPTLNLTIDHAVKKGGAQAAWRRGKSLSGLIEGFLQSLIKADEEADRLSAPARVAAREERLRRRKG